MPFDSVEAWDVMTDEIIEFQDSPHFLPTDAAEFTFIEIDDYKVRNRYHLRIFQQLAHQMVA